MQGISDFDKLGLVIGTSEIDHIGSFKLTVLEFFIRNVKLHFYEASEDQECYIKDLPSDFAGNIYRFA